MTPLKWDFSPDMLMHRREVAEAFGVASQTVHRWAVDGLLVTIKTPAGQRRYSREQVESLLTPKGPGRWSFSPEHLMRSGEVAAACLVDVRTVRRWGASGVLQCLTSPNGVRLFSSEQVRHLLTPPRGCQHDFGPGALMPPGDAARVLGVDPWTLLRRGARGEVCSIQLPGGHRRYSRQQVTELAAARREAGR